MAKHYSNATFSGFDYHTPSIEICRLRARDEGLEDRTRFEVADAKSYEGSFDLICFFDCCMIWVILLVSPATLGSILRMEDLY